MPNPELRCTVYDGDRIRIRRTTGEDGVSIPFVVEAFGDDDVVKDVYATADGIRDFARAALELIDGEGRDAQARPQVGDVLRVTKDNPRYCPVITGDLITVVETVYDHEGDDSVRFLMPGDDYRWYIPLSAVEPAGPNNATVPTASPTRLELFEAAKRLAPGGDVDDWLRIAIYLEEN